MPFAAALSEHPVAAVATGEVVGRALEVLGAPVDLAVVFASHHHHDAFGDVCAVVRAALAPGAMVGASCASVLAGDREVEGHPGLTLWAARGPQATAMTIDALPTAEGPVLTGVDPAAIPAGSTVLVLAEPDTFPTARVLARLHADLPGVTIVGGELTLGPQPGPVRLVADQRVVEHGAVALVLPPDVTVGAVLSQGGGPLGEPWVVTRADGPLVLEIGGRPALERLAEVGAALPETPDPTRTGPRLGRLLDERGADHGRGDFLLDRFHPEPTAGAIRLAEPLTVGTTVQFHRIDAPDAEEDLRELLAPLQADAALVLTSTGRGLRLYPDPDVDAGVVSRSVGGGAVAGASTLAEIGPVGGQPVHRRGSVVVLAFRDG